MRSFNATAALTLRAILRSIHSWSLGGAVPCHTCAIARRRTRTAMLHRAQQFGIDSASRASVRASRRSSFRRLLVIQAHLLGVRHDHFVPQHGQLPAHPRRMRPRLHRDATPRHATEYLLHGFRCGRQFVLQNNFPCFIQDAVRTGAISRSTPMVSCPWKMFFPLHRSR